MVDQRKLHEESNRFSDSGDSHDLPKIANWYHENILSAELIRHTGSKSFQDLVLQGIKESRQFSEEFVLVSLGAGHGQIENDLLSRVPAVSPGKTHFYAIDLFSPNDTVKTSINGEPYRLTRISQDLNQPEFPKNANMIIVHHALHHFVALEEIFESIHEILLRNSGTLVIADMVGRNGHMRWPESLRAINRIWRTLPQEKHFNNQFRKNWQTFENWDCSSEGYEGIRSEDIIKPLFQYFESSGSYFWGGVLDPFIDRGFGDNFDPKNRRDIEIIENIIEVENQLKDFGYLTATQVIGSFTPRKLMLAPSFTNFFSSKKYVKGLLPAAKNHIDEIVDSLFPPVKYEPKLIGEDNILKNGDLKEYLLSGWDTTDPTAIWGIGLESNIAFSFTEGKLAGLQLDCYILERAELGEVQVLINSDIAITQSLSPRTLIHLPPISITSLEIRVSFARVDTVDQTKDKRLLTFCVSNLTFLRKNDDGTQLRAPRRKVLGEISFKIRLRATHSLISYLPLRVKTILKSLYFKFINGS
jgi:SAM-dependent methyltransferase